MRQTTLWDSPEMSTALCRASDPDTSRIAAEAIASSLTGAKAAMLEAFKDGPKTAEEAATWCYQRDRSIAQQTYRKRVKELRTLLLIRPSAIVRDCEITGHEAMVWEVVQ